MARCSSCGREIPDGTLFCPYCGAQNQSGTQAKDVPPKSNKPDTPDKVKSGQSEKPKLTNKMKIVIIIAAAVVLVTAVVTVGFILKSRKTTFDFTTVQYNGRSTAPMRSMRATVFPLRWRRTPTVSLSRKSASHRPIIRLQRESSSIRRR